MLKMVIANPMLFTIVNAEPRDSAGAFLATSVENCGESPTTANPQSSNSRINSQAGRPKSRGDPRQTIPETSSIPEATLALPVFIDQ
jgi:hypothetical protein